jgi:plastocyanin
MVGRKVVASVVGGAAILLGLVGALPSATAADQSVSIVEYSFAPGSVTVQAGDTVTWTNDGTTVHTVTADDGSFSSSTIGPGDSYSHTFTSVGAVPYYCAFHGGAGGSGMAAQVSVQAPATTSTTAPPSVTTTPTTSGAGATTSTPTTIGGAQLARTGTSGAAPVVGIGLVVTGVLALAGARRRQQTRAASG